VPEHSAYPGVFVPPLLAPEPLPEFRTSRAKCWKSWGTVKRLAPTSNSTRMMSPAAAGGGVQDATSSRVRDGGAPSTQPYRLGVGALLNFLQTLKPLIEALRTHGVRAPFLAYGSLE